MINEMKLDKLNRLREQQIDPYPTKFDITAKAQEIIDKYDNKLKDEEETEDVVSVAGRIMQMRGMGKVTFMHVMDRTGRVQVYFRQDDLGKEEYNKLKLIDIGDIVGIRGYVFKTKTGEVTIHADGFMLLTKSLAVMPDKWHGVKDTEVRYRKRFIDLIANRDVFNIFVKRAELIRNMRKYLEKNDFIEVETPVFEDVPGGADARPFKTHHNALDIDLYLRISLELHLKRLMVGGYERVFEIGKVFRNEGISTQHLQEFTMLEFYFGYINYETLMKFVQEFYQSIIKDTFGTLKIRYQEHELDFSGEWPRVDFRDIVLKKTGIDILKEDTKEKLMSAIKAKGLKVDVEPGAGRGRVIDYLYKQHVRPQLIQPCFLINHPVAISPLAKRKKDNPELTERFQVLIVGAEVGNGFSELNDPIDQRKRFEEQMSLREQGDEEAQRLDENFLESLEIGMPPTAGFGVGIDRLLMILANQECIRDVVLFPTMRPEEE